MPYMMVHEDDMFCVHKQMEDESPGEKIKCHKTEQEAKDHMAALYASEGKNALKAISETDDELRVGNYIVLFGGRDLEGIASTRKNPDGSLGEHFSPNVEIESSYTKSGHVLVDWEHGFDPDEMGNDQDELLGHVDMKSIRRDAVGIYAERVLNRRAAYMQWLEELIKAGLVGNSTEAIDKGVKKHADGEIMVWPLRRDTLTVNPMESRMLTENAVAAFKALGLQKKLVITPDLGANTATQTPEGKPEAEKSAASEGGESADIKPILQGESKMENTPELQALLKEVSENSAKEAVKLFRESEPEIKTADIKVTKDEADQQFASAGEFFMAVKSASSPNSSADRRLASLKQTGMGETVPSHGGFLVPEQVASGILEKVYGVGTLMSIFPREQVAGNSMTYNVSDETSRADGSRYGGIAGYWLAEAAQKTASHPLFRQLELKLKKVAALVYATDELLEDAGALQSWIMNTVPNELRFRVEDAIINGTGVGQPLGILASPALLSLSRTTTDAFDVADIGRMWGRRYPGANDYVWLASHTLFPSLLGLVVGTTPVFLPAGGVSGLPYATLLGRPYYETEYQPAAGTAGDLILASPSNYKMIEKAGGIQSASSIHVNFIYDESVFRFVYRVDGCPLWASAVTEHDAVTTISPYVTLAATTI
jgi:HK97 family phage major capsid protein